MADARKGSQIGAGQGREGLDNTRNYARRVGGESTAVFPSPLMLPPYYNNLTLFFFAVANKAKQQRGIKSVTTRIYA